MGTIIARVVFLELEDALLLLDFLERLERERDLLEGDLRLGRCEFRRAGCAGSAEASSDSGGTRTSTPFRTSPLPCVSWLMAEEVLAPGTLAMVTTVAVTGTLPVAVSASTAW